MNGNEHNTWTYEAKNEESNKNSSTHSVYGLHVAQQWLFNMTFHTWGAAKSLTSLSLHAAMLDAYWV